MFLMRGAGHGRIIPGTLALASLLGGAGCLFAPAAPDSNPDANPPDPALCRVSTDLLGPVAVVSEDDSNNDTIFRVGVHEHQAFVWRFAPGATTLECANQRITLDADFEDVSMIKDFAIATARIISGGSTYVHVFAMIVRASGGAYVHDLTLEPQGTISERALVGANPGAGMPIVTADPKPVDPTPNFVAYVSNLNQVWFGGGTRLTAASVPLQSGMIPSPDPLTSADVAYGVESGALSSDYAILEGGARQLKVTYSAVAGPMPESPLPDAFDPSCAAQRSACTGRVVHPLSHRDDVVPILAYSIRAGHASSLADLAVTTSETLATYSLGDTVGDAVVLDVELHAIADSPVLSVLWQLTDHVELWRYSIQTPSAGAQLPSAGKPAWITTTPSRLAAVQMGGQARLLLLSGDPMLPDECLQFDPNGNQGPCR